MNTMAFKIGDKVRWTSQTRGCKTVKRVIKQHIAWGKEPPIGAFIQYDRRVKCITAGELTTLQ
jgi:hypothetical protein